MRADVSLVTEKEITLAKSLVGALAGPFEPVKYRDKYRDRLEAAIAAKVEGRQTTDVALTQSAKPAVDIMEALRKSLDVVKKPAVKAAGPKRKVSKRTGSSK